MFRSARAWATLALALCALAALFVVSATATDRSGFCSACHEMQPYYDAWARGAHHSHAECVDCHVNAGLPARFAHKFVALKEVAAHFSGDTSFPRPAAPDVPDARCKRCHPSVPPKIGRFPHALHAEKGRCAQCHFSTGHDVMSGALKAAGVFNASVHPVRLTGKVAGVGRGKANLPGHRVVTCSGCHDMKATGCAACHVPPSADHRFGAECARCHQPGKTFAFTHPAATARCLACHKPPAAKHAFGADCAACHRRPGKTWAFSHPSAGARCAACHKPPAAKHPFGAACASCHRRPGQTWAFSHPGGTGAHSWHSFACVKCHPQSLTRAACTCHKNGIPGD